MMEKKEKIMEILIDDNGDIFWFVNYGQHRGDDLPAVIKADGTREWFVDGLGHRDNDLPSIIWDDETKLWCDDEELYRDGGFPAIERSDGSKEWYYYDKLHRYHDLPAILCADGSNEWWVDGKRHRDDDFPAIECADGTKEWWVDGNQVSSPKIKKEYPKRPEKYVCQLSNDVCLICHESPWMPVRLEGRHVFCMECIDNWLDVSRTNPVSRRVIGKDEEYEKMF